ncbi:MAG TPA: hypothetical protein VGD90_12345 [Sphingobacteriaceae bacterium]
MKAEKLTDIKKELTYKNEKELTDLTLRLAKYKKENKELLSYLLYYADDPMQYAEMLKTELEPEFATLQKHYYYSSKSLRKILRTLNRHIKYTGSKQVEAELLLWFSKNYLEFADLKTTHKPLRLLLIRQLQKISKVLPKLHEDLQFDYQQEFDHVIEKAEQGIRWFSKKELDL